MSPTFPDPAFTEHPTSSVTTIGRASFSSTHLATPTQEIPTPSDNNLRDKFRAFYIDKEKSEQDKPEHGKPLEKNSKETEVVQSTVSDGQLQVDDFPDGGLRAWLVVLGAMLNAFGTLGFVTSWGVFQAYYQTVTLRDQSPSSIAWIGSLQYALIFFPALVVGRLFDIGYYRVIFLPCSALLVLATFLIPECTKYWHFILCQGLAVGVACGGLQGATTAILAHWFKRRRGLALGLFAVGASFGGILLPIAVKNLIPSVGFPWTMRILGFILVVTVGPANVLMKRRLPPAKVSGGLFNFAAFKDPGYSIYCFGGLLIYLGLYTVLTYAPVRAAQLGTSEDLSFYFVSFANAGSLFGRYSAGLLADRLGPMNIIIPFTLLTGILTCIWPIIGSTAALIVVTIIYGFCSGSFTALMIHPLMNLGGEADVGRRIGMFTSIIAIGALAGPPISGAINDRSGGFKDVGLYAGLVVIAGVSMIVVVRRLILKGWVGKA